ncbi:MAG: ATP:cob(I)alamin adenosyltransferase [Phycisphaerae bacterium]|nr:ATP:cob(I)alamin adenosyltransferase [Phycisphaerae bacterium]
MVRLTKIYTRGGDDGTTSLGDGARVSKTSPRVECYGTVDEANAAIGVAAAHCDGTDERSVDIARMLVAVQNDLFDVGADLCVPAEAAETPESRLRVSAAQTERLEREMDRMNESLEPLTSFVLPGGTVLAAALHHARTVSRRGERLAVALLSAEPEATNPEVVKYLNRLSDLLFVMARYANAAAGGDVLWTPGKHRDGEGSG